MSTNNSSTDLRSRKPTKTTTTHESETDQVTSKSVHQPQASDYNGPIFKLGLVSISMAILPIATYYGTLGHVFEASNTTGAAIAAIVVTNVILIGYVILAILEKDGPDSNQDQKK